MSFSYKFKTLRSGNSYDSTAQMKMSAHEKNAVTGEVEADATESGKEISKRFSPELVYERIKSSLETLHA